MYVHAYQSYVWNAIVSERIRTGGSDRPIVGDLVFEAGSTGEKEAHESDDKADEDEVQDMVVDGASVSTELVHGEQPLKTEEPEKQAPSGKSRRTKSWEAPKVKTLTEADLDKYSIFDVIMPLPGTDVAYPGGQLGERYKEYLRLDGLDPDNFVRKQKSVSLFRV